MAEATALAGKHQVRPLPFQPARLKGLSERLIVSHHENNYGGAVRNLNRTEQELATVTKDTPPFVLAALKERELTFANSATLHELYFGNLGGDGRPAGGSGWAILTYDFQRHDVCTFWSGNHTQACAFGQPLLVLDMFEHSYALDYGAAAAKYVDAFFQNVNWEEVDRRLERAEKVAADPRS